MEQRNTCSNTLQRDVASVCTFTTQSFIRDRHISFTMMIECLLMSSVLFTESTAVSIPVQTRRGSLPHWHRDGPCTEPTSSPE